MPVIESNDLPKTFPTPEYLTLSSFKKGVITLIDKSKLPRDALEEAENVFLVEDGQPSPRPGVDWYGAFPAQTLISTVTNLCANPSFENGFTGWSPTSMTVSVAIPSTYFKFGSASARGTVNSISPSPMFTYDPGALTVGQIYTFSIYVKAPAGATIQLSTTPATTTYSTTATSGWNLVTLTTSALANANTDFNVALTGGVSVSDQWYIDGAILVNSASATDYFDGDSTSSSGLIQYAWTGTAGSSTSTKKTYSAPVIDGFDYYDTSGTIHLVLAAGGSVYRSTNDGRTWTACTGATYTSGQTVSMNQYNSYLYITSGVDPPILYDGTTTLSQYASLATPAAPTVAETGLTGTGNQYYYKCARVNSIGFSAASAASSVVDAALPRESWDATSNFATVTVPAAVATQVRTDIYISTDNVNFYYLGSTATTTFVDDGSAIVVPSTTAPTASTATGPKVKQLVNVGSRMYGVQDSENPYRIWFTSGTAPLGAFSSAFDGGYLDWQPGGKYRPVRVEDYRDGKGTPLATVWLNSADGQGAIIQVSLDTLTVGDVSITVPSAYKLPGSRGTPSPGSVVNVLNDYFFYNSQAIYNLGSRAQFLNLLSTDEVSANIRPTVKQITSSAESGIASVYFDAKVYFSVPRGSTTNNYTMIYDTERKAWIPSAFTIGFNKFLRYTDTSGIQRLLATKPGDTRLSEISSGIQGDYGVAFSTSVTTGLYSTTKNRAEFQFTEQAEFELSNPQGSISVELLGTERSQGFSSTKTASVTAGGTPYGWDSFSWDTTLWDDTTFVQDPFSESSVWRYFTVQKELRAIQWRITTNSLDASYILRTLQTWGTQTQAGFPRQERLT